MRPSILCLLTWLVFITGAGAAEPPESVAKLVADHMSVERMRENGPGLLANSRLDGSMASSFTLGWAMPGLGAVGDRIWEIPLVESDAFTVAVYWHAPVTGVTRNIITESVATDGSPQEARQAEPLQLDGPDLAGLAIPDQAAAERAIRDLAPAVLTAGRRVVVLQAIRSYIAIPGLCEAGGWVWPCRIVAGTDEVHGLFWLDATSGAAKPIIVGP